MKKINGYINNYEEAALIMHAARLGALTPTTERLNNEEREKIESGNIFCFIENDNGMKRWTDGRIWSPSKICGEFLVYQEVPRHMSKNSIKKRKEVERAFESPDSQNRLRIQEDPIDRTTMHKKTVCIKHEDDNYHIIAYYRPIFANNSILDLYYFKKLTFAFNAFPQLKSNEFLRNHIQTDGADFHSIFGLQKYIESSTLESGKRNLLEGIALEVLSTLGRNSQKKEKLIYQKD